MPEDWDAAADAYAASPQVDWFDDFFDRHIPADLTGMRVLDVGCGHGWFAAQLHRRGADVHAVDHRRLGDYVAWLAGLGLGVTEVCEPPALVDAGWRRDIPTRLGVAAYRIDTSL